MSPDPAKLVRVNTEKENGANTVDKARFVTFIDKVVVRMGPTTQNNLFHVSNKEVHDFLRIQKLFSIF